MSHTSEKNSSEPDFEKLKFMRIFDPVHIPKFLIEQIKDRDYEVEQFYEFQSRVCLLYNDGTPRLNPYNLLYLVITDDNVAVGMLWCVVAPLSEDLVIQTFSMHKDYWCQGKAVKLLEEKVREIKDGCELNKVFWVTRYPRHSEKYGWKRSKGVLMEYAGEENKEEEDGSVNVRGVELRRDGPEVLRTGATEPESADTAEHADAPATPKPTRGRPRKSGIAGAVSSAVHGASNANV